MNNIIMSLEFRDFQEAMETIRAAEVLNLLYDIKKSCKIIRLNSGLTKIYIFTINMYHEEGNVDGKS